VAAQVPSLSIKAGSPRSLPERRKGMPLQGGERCLLIDEDARGRVCVTGGGKCRSLSTQPLRRKRRDGGKADRSTKPSKDFRGS